MTMISHKFRLHLRNMEKHFAGQAEQREEKAIAAHMAAVNRSLGKPSKRRRAHTEPMPYRLHIAVAFASLASALFSLYWWHP